MSELQSQVLTVWTVAAFGSMLSLDRPQQGHKLYDGRDEIGRAHV